jgi:hypothetical protein
MHIGSLYGDRKENLVQTAKVVRSPCSNQGNIFVPIDYQETDISAIPCPLSTGSTP